MTNVAKRSIAFSRHNGVSYIKEAGQLFSAKFDASTYGVTLRKNLPSEL